MFDPFEAELEFALHSGLPKEIAHRLSERDNWDPELNAAILSEASKFAATYLAPINQSADQQGCAIDQDHNVSVPSSFHDAMKAMSDAGWHGLEVPEAYGGQALPKPLGAAVSEIFYSANMAFCLCPLLNMGQIAALEKFGDQQQKETYIPKLASGEWVGTMNLTEPQAGTDLAAIKTTAIPDGDHYLLTGQKIFITFGDHDLSENISHLVLARIEGAPKGHAGLSLFLVPKFLSNADGSLGKRNDVYAISLEHKLGIHSSPTAVMQFGENGGAVAYRVGAEHEGLKMMFAMMNHARFGVGIQGVAIAARAFGAARSYAAQRVQGIPLGQNAPAPIHHHPDVKRLLATLEAEITANRAVMIYVAALIELAKTDEAYRARADLFIPIFKAYATERSVDLTSDALQVHGGMGYIEETGAAQHMRDARITTIYEGTTAIQANDLLFRKTLRDGGKTLRNLFDDMRETQGTPKLNEAINSAQQALDAILGHAQQNERLAGAVSVPFLMMLGTLASAWLIEVQAQRAREVSHNLADRLRDLAAIHHTHILSRVKGYEATITNGAQSVENLAHN